MARGVLENRDFGFKSASWVVWKWSKSLPGGGGGGLHTHNVVNRPHGRSIILCSEIRHDQLGTFPTSLMGGACAHGGGVGLVVLVQ